MPQATAEIEILSRLFQVLPAHPRVLAEWQRLVTTFTVTGKQTHDAHLAAIIRAHSLDAILTFNVRDFERYRPITVLDPTNV